MLNIGIVGVGYWGPNIVRNFSANKRTNVKMVADLRQERLDFIQSLYPTVQTTQNFKDIINDPKIEAVAICTPVFTHFEIAKAVLEAGKHVMIEKPMTSTSAQSAELINLAEQKNLTIMVDHTFLFTGAVRRIKHEIESGAIGDIYYFDSVRVNLGLFQHDINVIWDLAPHDISIMDFVISQKAEAVSATGADHVGKGLEDVAYLTVYYPDNIIAHIHVNWLSPVKVRQTLIGGSKKMIVWDDNSPSEKIKIYDKGIEVIKSRDQIYDTLIQYRTGDMISPNVPNLEALALEVDHFVDCIEKNERPISDGHLGHAVVKILEASEKSIKSRGKEVLLD